MLQTAMIAAGGASGALMRFWASNAVYAWLGRGFPYGTLLVNVFGSLLMGLLFVFLTERYAVSPDVRAGILVGFLGAFTTFSTFSIETIDLIERVEYTAAIANMLLSVVLCVAAAWIGVMIARQL